MKILILGFTKLKFMPYMNYYLSSIDAYENDVHVLYWNRDLLTEDTEAMKGITLHEFRCYQEDDVSKIMKIRSFYQYRKFAYNVLRNESFDFVFVLHSLPGVLMRKELKKHFTGKYILDYRDSTYEYFPPFKNEVGKLVKDAYATFVSSDAFRKFLPQSEQGKIYTSHNLLLDSLNHRDDKLQNGIASNKIRIAFWGLIRHEAINREMIHRIAEDSRFELHYYGREQQVALNLKSYSREIGATNIFFHGEYKPEDRYRFILQTDIIHNIYYDANTMLAMGNKYYDGAVFRIPQLCMTGSYMGKKVTENYIGLECNPYEEDFTEKIACYMNSLSSNDFFMACDAALNHILEQIEEGQTKIREAVSTYETS